MSASFNNAVLGLVLRVGTIPSANLTPNFNIDLTTVYSMDGGLITSNGNVATLSPPPTPSGDFWWIGPDGENKAFSNDPNLLNFAYDGYSDNYSGCWFDTEKNMWGAVESIYLRGENNISYLNIDKNTLNTFYGRFSVPLFFGPLISGGYYSQTPLNLTGGFSNNFSYAGIDQVICNTYLQSGHCIYNIPYEISIPYGDVNMDFNGAIYYSAYGLPCTQPSPAAPSPVYFGIGPVYRPGYGKNLFSFPSFGRSNKFNFIISTNNINSGQWHNTSVGTAVPQYVGRLWNGFVFINTFTTYTGCVYTEDCITFYPLLDITGNIDFSNGNNFGNVNIDSALNVTCCTLFMTGYGYGYVANYMPQKNIQGTQPPSQAAYKIYPAFNFNPLVPDKFFVPNICGCNNSAPILKNGVIQHA